MGSLYNESSVAKRTPPGGEQSQHGGRYQHGGQGTIARALHANGLSVVLVSLFLVFLLGQTVTGFYVYNDEQRDHHEQTISISHYLTTGHFIEATAENWESEFLQMFAYVLLTVFLVQKGSSESKDPDKQEKVDEDPRAKAADPQVPWPVRRGGIMLKLYENSLSLAFLLLFLVSLVLHVLGGTSEYNAEQIAHGHAAIPLTQYLATSQFWFESMQNWQSEFLAIASMVILTIFLRQRGSPESKPVASPHVATGE